MGANGTQKTTRAVQSPSIETIEFPLCQGAGEITRAEILERLGVKEFATVVRLSAEEAFRLLQSQYRQDADAVWHRYQSELPRRIADAEQQHSARVHELESQLKLARERSSLEAQRVRTELKLRIRAEQSGKEVLWCKVEEHLSDLASLRSRNAELEAEISKAARRGRLEEISFEQEIQTVPGLSVSEKLPRGRELIGALRELSGAPVEPRILVDNKNKSTAAKADIRKLVRDAKQRNVSVAIIVATDETQPRQADREYRCIEKELGKAAKAIGAACDLATKYKVRLISRCDGAHQLTEGTR